MKIESVNEFVIRFANVNGTGSASANNMFSKAVFRMGVPVSPKNIFPSNIQGLPTWFEVRVTERGYLGSRGDVDFMVAINGQTLEKDYYSVIEGGYFLFDSTKELPRSFKRDDITHLGIPLTRLCIENYTNPRQRQLFKNLLGAASQHPCIGAWHNRDNTLDSGAIPGAVACAVVNRIVAGRFTDIALDDHFNRTVDVVLGGGPGFNVGVSLLKQQR